jgi:hypothetical protein
MPARVSPLPIFQKRAPSCGSRVAAARNGLRKVFVRIAWGATDPDPHEQMLRAMRGALRSAPDPRWQALANFPEKVSLWRLIHDREFGFLPLSREHPAPRLVFLFAQLEELFTIGQRKRSTADGWRDTLAALVENRSPAALREELRAHPDRIEGLDVRSAHAKFLITLRHDYLHLLERWRRTMPSLFDNRFELKQLNGRAALEAVLYPGQLRPKKPPIVDEHTGRAIVRFVAGTPADKPLAEIEAVPPLLSLVCAELNSERLKHDVDRIVFDPFVEEPLALRKFLEALPLNADRRRDPVTRASLERALIAEGLSDDQISSSLERLAARGLLSFVTEDEIEYVHITRGFLEFAGRTGKDILKNFY